jgi:hypothetical protein
MLVAASALLCVGACDSRVSLGFWPKGLDGGPTVDAGGPSDATGAVDATGASDALDPTTWPWISTFEAYGWPEWMASTTDITGGGSAWGAQVTASPAATMATPMPVMPHGGKRYAVLALGVGEGTGTQFVHFFRQGIFPKKTRFGAWFYFPDDNVIPKYWNLMQFYALKTQMGPLWDVDLIPDIDGGWSLALFDRINNMFRPAARSVVVAPQTWVHIEVIYDQATTATGSIALLLGGMQVLKVDGAVTAKDEYLQFYVGSLVGPVAQAGNITPTPVLYLDDVMIAPEP